VVRSEHLLFKIISKKFLHFFLYSAILAGQQRHPERKITVWHFIVLRTLMHLLRFLHHNPIRCWRFNLWLGLGQKEVGLGSRLDVLVGHVDLEGSRRCESFLLQLASLQCLDELALDSFFDALQLLQLDQVVFCIVAHAALTLTL